MTKLLSLPLRAVRLLFFALFYFKELVWASILLAYDIVRPHHSFKHGIIAYDIELKNPTAIIALANLISMTPGSLSVELTPDRKKLFIHAMYLENPEAFKKDIKQNYERRIKNIFE